MGYRETTGLAPIYSTSRLSNKVPNRQNGLATGPQLHSEMVTLLPS